MPKVDVFGTLHVDRPGKVKAELTEFYADPDVFFVEEAREELEEGDEWELLLRNPIMRIAGAILNLIWGFAGFLLTRSWGSVDGYVVNVVAEEREIDIAPVDLNLIRRASDVPLWISALSWALSVVVLVLFVLSAFFASIGLALWGVLLGFLPIRPFARRTLSERDKLMAENIEHVFAIYDDLQNGCLVVGRGHMEGVIDELEETEVEVGETHTSKFFRRNS